MGEGAGTPKGPQSRQPGKAGPDGGREGGGSSKLQSLSPLWKQFSLKINSFSAATQNFLPPQDASGLGGAAGIQGRGGGPGSHRGGGEEVKGVPRGAKREGQSRPLTRPPQSWRPAKALCP